MSFGAFNKKSSSTTYATSNTSGFSEVSGQVTNVMGTGNVLTDQGAVKAAFDFGTAALGENSNLALEVVQASGAIYQGYGQQLERFAEKATADQGDKMAEVIKWLIGGLVIIAGAAYMKKAKA